MNERMHKINRIGRIIIDSLMVMLLWAILILPISSVSLLRYKTNNTNVLGGQDIRQEIKIDDTKTVRDYQKYSIPRRNIISETSDNFYIYDNRGNR